MRTLWAIAAAAAVLPIDLTAPLPWPQYAPLPQAPSKAKSFAAKASKSKANLQPKAVVEVPAWKSEAERLFKLADVDGSDE